MRLAQRIKRVFKIDVERRPACGGAVRIIACIEDPPVIYRILSRLASKSLPGLWPQSPAPLCRDMPTPSKVRVLCRSIDYDQESGEIRPAAGCTTGVRRQNSTNPDVGNPGKNVYTLFTSG
jgi:hypothetical protein